VVLLYRSTTLFAGRGGAAAGALRDRSRKNTTISDIERKALVAVRWLDRAFLTGDELVALLYRFFALEALLGRKSEGLKAHGLALRQMVLAHAVTGSFPNPNATLLLYDKIRSGAVHGEERQK
jgi:hypothetical protein